MTKATSLSPLPLVNGEMRRMLEERCQAFCKLCEETVSGWTDYDNATNWYKHHMHKWHRLLEDVT